MCLASAEHPMIDNVEMHQLTRLKRRVFPESHSPTSSTALLTVLLERKYFRNTKKREQGAIQNTRCVFTKDATGENSDRR